MAPMKRLFSLLFSFALTLSLLTGCHGTQQEPDTITVACTTYPVYLLAQELTAEVEGVEPMLVIDQQVSCLHDYTLTMKDMKAVEKAQLLAINGGGMEEFLEDVLETRAYLDCSEGLALLWNEEEEEYDSHCWLSPQLYAQMAENLAQGLSASDPEHAQQYQAAAKAAAQRLDALQKRLQECLSDLSCRQLITFHDGFRYFADAMGLEIVASVEEEEGSEASARRIVELTQLIDRYQIPTIFTEVNGSDSTAVALSFERGTRVAALNLGMSRSSVPERLAGLDAYEWLMESNVQSILEEG